MTDGTPELPREPRRDAPVSPRTTRRRQARQARKDAEGIGTFVWHTRIRGSTLALFWNVGAWGAAAFLALELEGTGWEAWGRTAGVAMIGIGALLAGVAFRRYLRYRLDGAATLFLLPPRPCLGEPFTILFRHAKAPADGRLYAARLRCAKHVYLGGDSSITTVWTQDHRMSTGHGIAETTLSPPVHLPPSHSESGMGDSYHWSIDLDRGGYVQTYEFKLGCVAG